MNLKNEVADDSEKEVICTYYVLVRNPCSANHSRDMHAQCTRVDLRVAVNHGSQL